MKKISFLSFLFLCVFAFCSCNTLLFTKKTDNDNEDTNVSFQEVITDIFAESEGTSPEDIEANVICAVDYEKDVITTDEYSEEYYEDKPHIVKIPKIDSNTSSLTIKSINDEIYNKYYPLVELLKSNQEESQLISIDYDYVERNNIIAIYIKYTHGYQFSEFYEYNEMYYYDRSTDSRLSFTEYLDAMNVDFQKLVNLVNRYNTDTLPFTNTVPYLTTYTENTITGVFFKELRKTYVIYQYDGENYLYVDNFGFTNVQYD